MVSGSGVSICYLYYWVSKYAYLGVNSTSSGAWDSHVKDVCVNGIKKLNQLHSNRDINLCTRR